METSTSAGNAPTVVGRLTTADSREEPLPASTGQAREELAVQPHELKAIVAGADRPTPERPLRERRLVAGGLQRSARERAGNAPRERYVLHGRRAQPLVEQRPAVRELV